MLTNRSWGILIGAWTLQVWAVSAACGQVSIREQFTISGTVAAVAAGRLTMRDNDGTRLEVRVQGKKDQGVMLSDGSLLAFPADVQIAGTFDVALLKPGQVVRFRGRVHPGGRSEGEVDALTLIDAEEATVGIVFDEQPAAAPAFAACEIIAAVKQATKGRLLVQLPESQAPRVKGLLSFKLAAGVQAGLVSSDPRRIEAGAKVVRLDAVRLNTGDVLAKRIVVEAPAGMAVKERGDDLLANTYRALSNEPKPQPRLIRSPHFAFLTDVSDREARIILDKLERMAGLLERFFGRRPGGVVEGFIVHDLSLFPAGTFSEAAGVAKIREGAGVCFNASLGRLRKATLYSCADHGVIQHECTHGFCHMTFGSTGPTWLSEGIAELGNYWRDGEQAVDIEPVVMAYLQQAEPKRTLAEIATPGREPAGTWQDYAWRWALCHLLANNPNYSDRFKPLAVALMEGRPDVSFESVYGPVARELAFEYDAFLRDVGNGYRADLTAWPWKSKFRSLPPSGGRVQAIVRAAAGWQASGLRVEKGVVYEAAADGMWRTAPAGTPVGADGDAAGHGGLVGAVLLGAERGAEPGAAKDDGAAGYTLSEGIPLGAKRAFVAPADGLLVLRCDDDWTQLADNAGELTVTLRRTGSE